MTSFIKWANKKDVIVHDDTEHGSVGEPLVWGDIETTGLNMKNDVVLEVGLLITDSRGRLIEDGVKTMLIDGNDLKYEEALRQMPTFVRSMHTASGLLTDLRERSTYSPRMAASLMVSWLLEMGVNPKTAEFAGSSVHFDREMLRNNNMEDLENHFHYRNLDISSIKNACRRLNPDLFEKLGEYVPQAKKHRPLDDIIDSIKEYQFYIDNFLWTKEDEALNA